MAMSISPFLEKKFFEFLDERLAKGAEIKNCYYNQECSSLLPDVAKIMANNFECLFFHTQEEGRRRIFMVSERNYLKLLQEAYEICGILHFHNGRDGFAISIDSEDEGITKWLYFSAYGDSIKVIKEFVDLYGGRILDN